MERLPSMNGIETGQLLEFPPVRGRVLLAIARQSLAEALGLGLLAAYDAPWLYEPGASFVTLRRQGRLRGCVGSIQAYRSLFEDVRANARAAAFSDTRFPPVARDEYPEIDLEVSLLSAPEPFEVSCEAEALERLRPGRDGVIFECEGCRSTFLPQVWDSLREPRDFLGQLKRKAGLPAAYWSPDVRLWRYTVTKWAERE
jgi:AmmeMemoRadiSam system protein A